MKLKVINSGLALGMIFGVLVFLITLVNLITGWYAEDYIFMLSSFWVVYPGAQVNFLSCLLGGFLGFVDGFVIGAVFAWIYNLIGL